MMIPLSTILFRATGAAVFATTFALVGCALDTGDTAATGEASEALGALPAAEHAAFAKATDPYALKLGVTQWGVYLMQGGTTGFAALNAQGRSVHSFLLRRSVDLRGDATYVFESTTTGHRMALDAGGRPTEKVSFSADDRALLQAMATDLNEDRAPELEVAYMTFRSFLKSIGAGLICGAAAIQGGANLANDGACAIAIANAGS